MMFLDVDLAGMLQIALELLGQVGRVLKEPSHTAPLAGLAHGKGVPGSAF